MDSGGSTRSWLADQRSSSVSPESNATADSMNPQLSFADVFVFSCLEFLGILAVMGNCALMAVIIRYKYLTKASFVLMFSLAVADVLHGTVTACHFYPPIVLKHNYMPYIVIRLFNVIDWTAWSITITHMSAICVDRLIAIMLFGKYTAIVTTQRVRTFSAACWFLFGSMNMFFFAANFCCVIEPLPESDYYSFGYVLPIDVNGTTLDHLNVYPRIYMPLEVATLLILAISNPITLLQLWRRHKRKLALRRASAMLLEMSQTMTMRLGPSSTQLDDAGKIREAAARKASRQQQRVFIQITVVAIIFFAYMFVYYLFFYIVEVSASWAVMFNSFFYSTTHMINPVIYFGLNEEMRAQLMQTIKLICCCCCRRSDKRGGSLADLGDRSRRSVTTETSPLLSARNVSLRPNPMSNASLSRSVERIQYANNINDSLPTTNRVSSVPATQSRQESDQGTPAVPSRREEPTSSLNASAVATTLTHNCVTKTVSFHELTSSSDIIPVSGRLLTGRSNSNAPSFSPNSTMHDALTKQTSATKSMFSFSDHCGSFSDIDILSNQSIEGYKTQLYVNCAALIDSDSTDDLVYL
uniref:G-protein coupled receptors family 1 profile domain-containing protein n=1 Tax=Plectus sambesii TaxID=2011161 RepID=A0A914WC09_9BILA